MVILVHVHLYVVIVIHLDARESEIAAVGLVVQVGLRELGAQLGDVWKDPRRPARRHCRKVWLDHPDAHRLRKPGRAMQPELMLDPLWHQQG